MSAELDADAAEERSEAATKSVRGILTASPDSSLDRRSSELNGRLVIEAVVRSRPRSLRCTLAPHAAEVSVFRPESRYHRLVFTMPEWDKFLADVKTGRYDMEAAS
jgi:hypothetical protein